MLSTVSASMRTVRPRTQIRTVTSLPQQTKVVLRSQVMPIVARISEKHGQKSLSRPFPSLSAKFKIVSEVTAECNQQLLGNGALNAIRTPQQLIEAMSEDGSGKQSLLEQSYDVFNTVDTVKAYFDKMEKEGTRPVNLYYTSK